MVLSSVCRVKNTQCLSEKNYIDFVINFKKSEYVKYNDRFNKNWACNIQQIKKEYNGVAFLIYYEDCVALYKINKNNYAKIKNFSSKQHKGNNNECQLTVNEKISNFLMIF